MTSVPLPRIGPREILLLLMVALMWGGNNVGVHLIGRDMHPITAAGVRFVLTTLFLAPWLAVPRDHIRTLLLIGLIGGPLHFGLLYTGFSMSRHVGALTVVMQMWVPLSVLLAMVMLHEHPTRQQLTGVALAFIGIGVMCFDPMLVDEWAAALTCFGATSCWGMTMVLTRRAVGIGGLAIQAWMALLTGPLLLLAGGLLDPESITGLGDAPLRFWLLTLFAIVGASILGNVVLFNLVQRFRVVQTTPILLTTPVFAALIGLFLLNERIGVQEAAGAAMTLASVLFIVRGGARTSD